METLIFWAVVINTLDVGAAINTFKVRWTYSWTFSKVNIHLGHFPLWKKKKKKHFIIDNNDIVPLHI